MEQSVLKCRVFVKHKYHECSLTTPPLPASSANTNHPTTNRNLCRPHLPNRRIPRRGITVKDHLCTCRPHRRTPRTIQRPAITPTHQQRARRLRIRTPNGTGSRVAGIVFRPVVAIAAEEEIVRAADEDQVWRFDEGAVGGVAVEDLGGGAGGGDAVGFDGLQHDGRGVGSVAVATDAAAAEAVAVDFVHDVEGAVRICEAGCVDCAALAVMGGFSGTWREETRVKGRLTLRDRRKRCH